MGGQLSNASGLNNSLYTLEGKTILYDKANATNTATALRTVTAGKTYYLVQASLSYHCTADLKQAYLFIVGVPTKMLFWVYSQGVADGNFITITYPHPIPFAAGTQIAVGSDDAAMFAQGYIIGWEE